MRRIQWMSSVLGAVVFAGAVDAQRVEVEERAEGARRRAAEVVVRALERFGGDPEGAVLGVTTASSGERDTLGLLVVGVERGSPADAAGIEEGHRLAAINDVNLRLSREDAGERDMTGLTTRRLVREMEKVKAGDEVRLSVWKDGRYQDVRVKTVARQDLPGWRRTVQSDADDRDERAVVGLTLQTTGSVRDTSGPMIVRLVSGGPAEKAGLVEGDRIQAINGTTLRLAAADAEEPMLGQARVNRFSRILADLEPGAEVELRVYSGGQTRTVRVKTAPASEVYGAERRSFMFRSSDDAGIHIMPMAPRAPAPPRPPAAPRIYYRGQVHNELIAAPAPARVPPASRLVRAT